MNIPLWRDISVIWLSLFCIAALLPPIIILFFAMRGLNWLRLFILPWLNKAQHGSATVMERSNAINDRVAEPFIRLKQQSARIRTIIAALRPTEPPKRQP